MGRDEIARGGQSGSYGVGRVTKDAAGSTHQDGVSLPRTGSTVLRKVVHSAQRRVTVAAQHAEVALLAEATAPGVASQPVGKFELELIEEVI